MSILQKTLLDFGNKIDKSLSVMLKNLDIIFVVFYMITASLLLCNFHNVEKVSKNNFPFFFPTKKQYRLLVPIVDLVVES